MIVCDIIISFFRSFAINFNQVCFRPPLGFFDDFSASLSAFFAGVSSGKRNWCPYQNSLLFFTILLQGDAFVLSYCALLLSFHAT